ncbi:MAG TPA: FAD-binding oxidoreductase [Aliiroseovarius sp.]|nr:FAD-binding oxidoreductase [Aliiroseovarius sp.]
MQAFPFSMNNPAEHRAALPDAVDCVVIGAGVIGVTAALYLARAGQKVLLLEKGRVAAEQSSRNWGWIRAQGRDMAEIPVALEARGLWRDLAADCGEDFGLAATGTLYLAQKPRELAGYEAWLADAQGLGLDSRMLSGAEVAGMLPEAGVKWAGALWTPSDMRAEPQLAVPALARLAAREGVAIREGCAVRLLDIQAGQVAGVITEDGPVRAGRVLLAGGAWSALLLGRHGVDLPQASVLSTAGRSAPCADVFDGCAADQRLAFRRRADGGYTLAPGFRHGVYLGPDLMRHLRWYWPMFMKNPLGHRVRPAAPRGFPDAWGRPRRWQAGEASPFERMRVLNPAPVKPWLGRLARDFRRNFPGLGPVGLAQGWAGMIDVMPDAVPVVDAVADLPGLVLATGMSGHGFGIGPGFGRIAASLMLGRAPGHDLTRFRLSRFSDGSPLVHGPEI